jgi:hypothetical protein
VCPSFFRTRDAPGIASFPKALETPPAHVRAHDKRAARKYPQSFDAPCAT